MIFKAVGEGVLEARIASGPGYRVYLGIDRLTDIILLLGGTKRTQQRDIKAAQSFWRTYLEVTGHE